jgi:hypothetical protein
MSPFRLLRPILLLAAGAALAIAAGCGPEKRDASPAGGGAGTQAAPPPATAATAPPTPPPSASPPATKGPPDAIKDLQAKLVPPGTPPPPAPPDEKLLLAKAEELEAGFVEALRKGDVDAAESFLFSAKDYEEAVTPGHRVILEASLTQQNSALVRKLADALKGQELKAVWKPGKLAASGVKSVFEKATPILSNSEIAIDRSGVPLVIDLDQLVFHRDRWKIFRLSTP